MTNKQEFEAKLELYKKFFYHKCLFCEEIIESSNFPPRKNQTLISTCEFCYERYKALDEWIVKYGKVDSEKAFPFCFTTNCYFCSFSWKEARRNNPIIGGLQVCENCCHRHTLLKRLEKEQTELEKQLKTQIEIPPKSGN